MLKEAKDEGNHVLIPQFGQALTEYMIEGLQHVEEATGLGPGWLLEHLLGLLHP